MRAHIGVSGAVSLLAFNACFGDIGDRGHASGSGGPGPDKTAACSPNDAIMKALTPTCSGCHSLGAAPFFASLGAFEDLVVYDTKYVVPGHPEKSHLVELLKGSASGTYKQMPLAGDSFVKLEAAGKTKIPLKAIEDWITALTPRPKNPNPDPGAVTVQRKSAEQIRATLYAQLGLGLSDFFAGPADIEFNTPTVNTLTDDNYPVYSPDEDDTCFTPEPKSRHASLGGAEALVGRKRELSSSPSFAQALIPISQRWCKMAIAKPTAKQLLFPNVDPSAPSAQAAADIKKNIAYMGMHFLGDVVADDEIADIFSTVFVPTESEADPTTAWAGVCSYFIRHPKWIFF